MCYYWSSIFNIVGNLICTDWFIEFFDHHMISDPFIFLWLKGSIKANVLRSLKSPLKKFFHVESSLSKKVSGWPLILAILLVISCKTWENVHLWQGVSPWKISSWLSFSQMTFWVMSNKKECFKQYLFKQLEFPAFLWQQINHNKIANLHEF